MTREERNEYIMNNIIVDTSYPTHCRFKNLVGQKFNHLLAIEYVGKNKDGKLYYKYLCDCGNIVINNTTDVISGRTMSCGCYRKENTTKTHTTHNLSKHRLYNTYKHFCRRCYSETDSSYANYGGRGIFVCDEWLNKENGFINFYNWSMDNGYAKDLSIDRIDVNGPYAPWNCRWANDVTQANNKQKNRYITYKNYKYTIAQWAKICGLPYSCLLWRLDDGWNLEDALFTPSGKKPGEEYKVLAIPKDLVNENKYTE